jgi:hypothetical protein
MHILDTIFRGVWDIGCRFGEELIGMMLIISIFEGIILARLDIGIVSIHCSQLEISYWLFIVLMGTVAGTEAGEKRRAKQQEAKAKLETQSEITKWGKSLLCLNNV